MAVFSNCQRREPEFWHRIDGDEDEDVFTDLLIGIIGGCFGDPPVDLEGKVEALFNVTYRFCDILLVQVGR